MIIFTDESLNVISFPIEDFTSMTWEESWTEPGAWSISLHPQEFDALKDAAYIYYDVCGWGVVESIEYTKDSFKLSGRELSAILDNYVITVERPFSARLEYIARTLVSENSNIGLGTNNMFAAVGNGTAERGSLLTALYNILTPRGMSFKVSVDTGITQRTVRSVAHRGKSSTAPENTIPAFEQAATDKFGFIETDIAFTSDGVAVCLHDSTVNRTSNGTGAISSMTLTQAKALDFGSWKDSSFAGTKIPTWAECVTSCKSLGLGIYCELKTSRGLTEARTRALIDEVETQSMMGQLTWISTSLEYLRWVRNYRPTARLGYLVDNTTQTNINSIKALRNGRNEVFILSSSWTNSEADLAEENGMAMEVCVIDDANTIKALSPYITGVLSNSLNADNVVKSNGSKGFVFEVLSGVNKTSMQSYNKIAPVKRQSSEEYVVLGQTEAASARQGTRLRKGSYIFRLHSAVPIRLGNRKASTGTSAFMTNTYSTDLYINFDVEIEDAYAFWVYRPSADGGVTVADIEWFELVQRDNAWAILTESKGNIYDAKYTKNIRDYKNYVVINVGDDENPQILEYDFRDVL